MISSTSTRTAYLAPQANLHAHPVFSARMFAMHAAASSWTGATQALRLAAMSVAIIPLTPIGLTMWFAAQMQRGREPPRLRSYD